MDKLLLITAFLILALGGAYTQDRIITTQQDTIECKIITISDQSIFYEQQIKNGQVMGKNISLANVAQYYRNTTNDTNLFNNQNKVTTQRAKPSNRLVLTLGGGFSYMPRFLDNISNSDEQSSNYDKLKNGPHINTGIHYLISNQIGLGIEHSFFTSKFKGDNYEQISSSVYLVSSEKHKQYVNFIGPSFMLQTKLDEKEKFTFRATLALGVSYIRIENRYSVPAPSITGYDQFITNTLMKGNNFGAKAGISVDYQLLDRLSLGLGTSFIYTTLSKADVDIKDNRGNYLSFNSQKLDNKLDFSRIDGTFIVRLHF